MPFTYVTITTWDPAPTNEELSEIIPQLIVWSEDGLCGRNAFDIEYLTPTKLRSHRAFLDHTSAQMALDWFRTLGFSESRANVVIESLSAANYALANPST